MVFEHGAHDGIRRPGHHGASVCSERIVQVFSLARFPVQAALSDAEQVQVTGVGFSGQGSELRRDAVCSLEEKASSATVVLFQKLVADQVQHIPFDGGSSGIGTEVCHQIVEQGAEDPADIPVGGHAVQQQSKYERRGVMIGRVIDREAFFYRRSNKTCGIPEGLDLLCGTKLVD